MITPPVGGLLFVTSNVSRVPMGPLVRELVPFLWAHSAVLVLLTFVPALSTWAPHALGSNNADKRKHSLGSGYVLSADAPAIDDWVQVS